MEKSTKKLGKKQAEKTIKDFFENIESKKPKAEEVRKMKRLAMHYNIKLGILRKKFCKKCFSVFNAKNSQTRIKNKIKIVRCLNCGKISRWKIKA